MALLERRFRNRFEASDGGYRFHQGGHVVVFTPTEVEAFVAERGRLWSYWTFAIYLALGVALPIWLWWSGIAAGAWVIGGLALLILTVLLVHGERLPNGVAEVRMPSLPEPDAADRVRYTPEEYDESIVEARRRWWRPVNLLFLAVYGAGVPIALYADHLWLAALYAALALGLLVHAVINNWRAPGVAAARRARGEAEPLKPEAAHDSGRVDYFGMMYLSVFAFAGFGRHSTEYYYSRWFALPVLALGLWQIAQRLYRWWQKPAVAKAA